MFDRYGDPRELPRQLIGYEVVDKVDQVWGLNSEGEVNSAWRSSGVQGLYFMMGMQTLSSSRSFSSDVHR